MIYQKTHEIEDYEEKSIMEERNIGTLLIDEEWQPAITEANGATLKPIISGFIEGYVQNQDKPIREWLSQKMQENLPEKTPEEVESITDDIVLTLEVTEEKQSSLESAIKNGQSKENWFASETQKAVSAMSKQETVRYLFGLDKTLESANEALYRTITTKAGNISQNPNLDGFIAEQYHAQTFNLNAEATGSEYRAKVLEPSGKGYAKNSVDVEIVDGNGKVVRRYQSKYCRDAEATQRAYEHGDYSFQRKLIPEGQENEILGRCTTVLEAPDGTTSKPLSKEAAKQLQRDAQGGKWKEADWNEYRTKDVAMGMAKSIGNATVQGAAFGAGINIAQKLFSGEEIDGEEVVETALATGADGGIKAAAAGAIKVGAEKGIVPAVLKDASVAGNVAFVAIENVKVIGQMMSGEMTGKEGIEKMEQTTVAAVAGLSASAQGAAVGAAVGAVLGPVGSAVGSFVGGAVSYLAGSKIGETITKGVQKARDVVVGGTLALAGGIVEVASAIWDGLVSLFL